MSSLCQCGYCRQSGAATMPVQSDSCSAVHMFPKSFFKHIVPALLAGLGLRLFFIWHFPFYSGDTAYYEELARNWLYHRVYGFYSNGQLLPSDARAPGYPAFLAGIYFLAGTGRKAVMLAQAFVDLATCVLAAAVAAGRAAGTPDESRGRVAATALWLTALCPYTANYAAVPLTEVLATFFTTLALSILLSPAAMQISRIASNRDLLCAVRVWFVGGFVIGLGTLVRPETPLLLAAALIALWLRYSRPANWRGLTVATLWMIVGLLLPLAPWAARNALSLGRVQFLAPRYAETYGDVLPTGFYAWTKTWMFRFRDAYLFTWKLPSQPIDLKNLPSYAVDSAEEFSRVASLLDRYNRTHGMTHTFDAEFAELARERAKRHPIRTYVSIPIERAAAMWSASLLCWQSARNFSPACAPASVLSFTAPSRRPPFLGLVQSARFHHPQYTFAEHSGRPIPNPSRLRWPRVCIGLAPQSAAQNFRPNRTGPAGTARGYFSNRAVRGQSLHQVRVCPS